MVATATTDHPLAHKAYYGTTNEQDEEESTLLGDASTNPVGARDKAIAFSPFVASRQTTRRLKAKGNVCSATLRGQSCQSLILLVVGFSAIAMFFFLTAPRPRGAATPAKLWKPGESRSSTTTPFLQPPLPPSSSQPRLSASAKLRHHAPSASPKKSPQPPIGARPRPAPTPHGTSTTTKTEDDNQGVAPDLGVSDSKAKPSHHHVVPTPRPTQQRHEEPSPPPVAPDLGVSDGSGGPLSATTSRKNKNNANLTLCESRGGRDDWKGNGRCNPRNNMAACAWDGGDCCSSTCTDSSFRCGLTGVCRQECKDPAANSRNCHGTATFVGGGDCDCFDVDGTGRTPEPELNLAQVNSDCGAITMMPVPGGLKACEAWCTGNAECAGFTFMSRFKICKFIADAPRRTRKSPSAAGPHECYSLNRDVTHEASSDGAAAAAAAANATALRYPKCGVRAPGKEKTMTRGAHARQGQRQAIGKTKTKTGGLGDDKDTARPPRPVLAWVGDGLCDAVNNIAECGYDGGDCCEATCQAKRFDCVASGVCEAECKDPAVLHPTRKADTRLAMTMMTTTAAPAPQHTRADKESEDRKSSGATCKCDGVQGWVGDGRCDTVNNNAACGYDGGDCCARTCTEGKKLFDCLDANVCTADCLDPREQARALADEQALALRGEAYIHDSLGGLDASFGSAAANHAPFAVRINMLDCHIRFGSEWAKTQWQTSAWSACSAACGGGMQKRTVHCENTVTGKLDRIKVLCGGQKKPPVTRACNMEPCV